MWEKREGKRPHIFFDDGSLKLQKIYPTSLAAASASAAKGGSREREREPSLRSTTTKGKSPPSTKNRRQILFLALGKKERRPRINPEILLRPRCQNASLLPERKAPFSFYIRLSSYFWGARTQFSHTKNRSVLFSSSAVSVPQR